MISYYALPTHTHVRGRECMQDTYLYIYSLHVFVMLSIYIMMNVLSFYYLIIIYTLFSAACLLPFFGGLADKYGKRAITLTIVFGILITVHLLMALTRLNPIPLMIGQGLSYTAMASTLWPSFSLIVPKRYNGLGFGIAFSMQNAGLSVIPLVIASIYTTSNDKYIPNVEYFFVIIAGIGVFFGIWLNIDDLRNGNILNRPLQLEDPSLASSGDGYESLLLDGDADVNDYLTKELAGDDEVRNSRASRTSRSSRVSEDIIHSTQKL